jgi:polysaccharide biosynthesis protein PelF
MIEDLKTSGSIHFLVILSFAMTYAAKLLLSIMADGADPKKLLVIPNGVNAEKFAALPRDTAHAPTIALIGRIVPIKDIKCFIHVASLLIDKIPDLKVYVMGPTTEDPDYYQECVELVNNLNLQQTVEFTGKVNVVEFIPKIDVVVLTSISESQPLVILEAGAAGIPCVTTDTGSCSELIYGKLDENPPLGPGGAVTSMSNPSSLADNILLLLRDKNFYNACSKAIRERVITYYNNPDIQRQYHHLYETLIQPEEG